MPLYCTQKHDNPPGSKFCHLCGEPLAPTSNPSPADPSILGLHYRLIRDLGQGGFGRTYLAEDIHRFNERCVLKEFAPQVQGAYAVQKAQELFEREAGVLYKLQHPQIPQFRELFTVQAEGRPRLFLVQDYVEGQTFHALLDTRRRQGQTFNADEITQLLQQVLPVLHYIHSLGVVHRDISPDNLMLRQADGLPVLIDFGGVKQVAATVESQFMPQPGTTPPATRLGKAGYAPMEQMQTGTVTPSSDLYALGMTALVLLTGREPQELLNGQVPLTQWLQTAAAEPRLATILSRMLAPHPGDRYPTAQAVLQDLGVTPAPATVYPPTQAPRSHVQTPPIPPTTQATHVASPTPANPVRRSASAPNQSWGAGTLALVGVVLLLAGVGSWWAARQLLSNGNQPIPQPTVSPSPTPTSPSPTAQFPPDEQTRKDAIGERRRQLGIDFQFFIGLVNQRFYQSHPELKGRQLSVGPEDAEFRTSWDQNASQLLNLLEPLSSQARSRMGQYGKTDRERWNQQVNQANLSSRAFYDLVDARFFSRFPDQRNQNFINQPIGQVWYAIAADEIGQITAGNALTRLQFAPGKTDQQIVGNLKPGEGRAFIVNLQQGQQARIGLNADPTVLLSFYPPTSKTPAFLEDSTEQTWSGTLPQSGYYELVVVSTAEEATRFELNVSAEAGNARTNPGTEPPP